jgi:cell division protein FtsL
MATIATATTAMADMEVLGTRQAQRAPRGRTLSVAERNRALFEAQLRNHRGPTPEIFFTKHIDNSRIVKADDPERQREMRTFAGVMITLFVLVMVYVWQHFSSIEIGYQVESQKAQVEQLREQNRQLRLTEAQLTDPGRIDRIARQLGLDTPEPGQVVRAEGDPNAPVMAQATAPALPVY